MSSIERVQDLTLDVLDYDFKRKRLVIEMTLKMEVWDDMFPDAPVTFLQRMETNLKLKDVSVDGKLERALAEDGIEGVFRYLESKLHTIAIDYADTD